MAYTRVSRYPLYSGTYIHESWFKLNSMKESEVDAVFWEIYCEILHTLFYEPLSTR